MKSTCLLRYRMIVEWSEEDHAFIARVPAFPGCMADGKTREKAIKEAEMVVQTMLEIMQEKGVKPPPSDTRPCYSGSFHVRMPKSLHGTLADLATVEGVSLNQLVVAALSEKAGMKKAHK